MAFLTDHPRHTNISRDSRAPYYDKVMAEYAAGVRLSVYHCFHTAQTAVSSHR